MIGEAPPMVKVLAFSLNTLMLAGSLWLLRAYWPFDRPMSPWNMYNLCLCLASGYLITFDVLWVMDLMSMEIYSSWRSVGARAILAFMVLYAVDWHQRRKPQAVTPPSTP